ncbi:hypothetical protein D3C78_1133130 [compost metagenome]
MGETRQVQAGLQQRRAIVGRRRVLRGIGVGGELLQHPGDIALGLQQQPLRIAGQLAGAEQFAVGEAAQFLQAGAEAAGQVGGQFRQRAGQTVDGLLGGGQAQGVAAAKVILDIARHLLVEAAR